MASVLAVVAGSPAQAANTAFEVKVDHDDNAATATVREFAGQDRYDTARRLAENFAASKGGIGAVPSVFLASGDTLVDSISVAGLAGYVDAPILLTPSGSLHRSVSDFIEDYGVGSVYVLGGTAAISDAAFTMIEELVSKPTVTRISGSDRYATAAAIAAMIDTDTTWCGTDAASAVLINGATDMMPFGVAAQTTAFRLQLPVLMTAADMLPDSTADFIDDNDIEHVQIIGGADIVSAEVASALTSLGVDTVGRVDGGSASAVSVEMAELANNGCSGDLGLVSSNRVALVRGNPDGVVAAPVLASSLDNGSLVSPLVVGDSLPAVVSDYLASTPKTTNGTDKLNLGIVAVGGTAAVSEATMEAALSAAALSGGALTVEIGDNTDTNEDGKTDASDPVRPSDPEDEDYVIDASADPPRGPKFSLYFSDDVVPDLAKLQDIIEINGVPAVVSAVVANSGRVCDQRRIDVTLGQHLHADDVIKVVASSATFGTGADQRTVAPASATVTAPAPDRVRPTIQIVGIAGTAVANADQEFNITFSDNVDIAGTAVLAPTEVRVVAGPGGAAVPAPTVTVTHTAGAATATVDLGRALVAGDRVIITPGAVADAAGNVSAGTSGSAIRAQASPVVSTVLMSEQKHTAHAVWTVPAAIVGGATGGHVMTISAKGGGDAAGVEGNGWTMVFDQASTYSFAKPLDIDVRVDTRGQRVTVRFNNGPTTATLGDLLAALKANADFDARFSAGFSNCETGVATTPLGLVAGQRNHAVAADGAGRTQFAIEVNFNAFVSEVRNAELLADILAATAVRTRIDPTETLAAGVDRIFTISDGAGLIVVDDLSADPRALSETVSSSTPPTRSVRYEIEAAVVRYLPRERDLVQTTAGHNGAVTAITGPPAYSVITADLGVATGYAADVPTPGVSNADDDAQDRIDENLNGASKRRITISGSVKTP